MASGGEAVSVYLPGATGPATQHYFAQQDNYLVGGDQSNSTDGSGFNQSISCWMFLSGVDVKASPRVTRTLITLGDSVTDGVASTTDANNRYPDWLARRLASRKGTTLSVSNAGVSGNALLAFQPDVLLFGFSAPSRVVRDVLTQAGA